LPNSSDFGDGEGHRLVLCQLRLSTLLRQLIQDCESTEPEIAPQRLFYKVVGSDAVVSRGATQRVEELFIDLDRRRASRHACSVRAGFFDIGADSSSVGRSVPV